MDIHISVYDPDELLMAAQFMQMIAQHRLATQQAHILQQAQCNPVPPPGYADGVMATGSKKAAYDINRDTLGGMPMSGLDEIRKGNAVMDHIMRDVVAYGIGCAHVTCDDGDVPMAETVDALLNVRDTPSYLSAQERLWSAIEAAAKP